MLIREVKKQIHGTSVSFEGTIVSCKAPELDGGAYHQFVQLADSSGKIWAKFNLGFKYSPLHNRTNIKVKQAKYFTGGLEVSEFTIPTKSEPEPGSPYEYNPAHPADEMSKEDWAAKDKRMARMCSLNNATSLWLCLVELLNKKGCADADIGVNMEGIKKYACEFLDWIYETETQIRKE